MQPYFEILHGSSSLQILFNFQGVFAVESLQFLIEFHITFVDVINILVIIMSSSATVFLSFSNPTTNEEVLRIEKI